MEWEDCEVGEVEWEDCGAGEKWEAWSGRACDVGQSMWKGPGVCEVQ